MAVSLSSTYHQLKLVKQASMTYAVESEVNLSQSTGSQQFGAVKDAWRVVHVLRLAYIFDSVEALYLIDLRGISHSYATVCLLTHC